MLNKRICLHLSRTLERAGWSWETLYLWNIHDFSFIVLGRVALLVDRNVPDTIRNPDSSIFASGVLSFVLTLLRIRYGDVF